MGICSKVRTQFLPMLCNRSIVLVSVPLAVLVVRFVRRRLCAQPTTSSIVQRISPKARVLATLGDPVGVVRTPIVFPAALERANRALGAAIDAVLVPLDVPPAALPDVFSTIRQVRNFDGVVITKPHKEASIALCDTLTPEALAVGAINVARARDGHVTGHILDGVGFCDGLEACGHTLRGERCLLVGAGGAAKAIAFTLRQRGVASVTVYNRTQARARSLVDALVGSKDSAAAPGFTAAVVAALPANLNAHFTMVVQCTSLGHRADDPTPFDFSLLTPPMLCAEVIHTPLETPFLAEARRRGCVCHHGAHMLDRQIDAIRAFLLD